VHVAVVIGGGRWGRILAGKLSGLGYRVFVATDFPSAQTDIKRPDIARLEPKPKLIYIASRSIDHEKDFKLVAALGAEVWIEKNFDGMSDALLDSFLKGENFVFSQQLFNTSLDRFATHLGPLQRFHIETEVEKPIETHVGLFDWICHDLSLIARILWLRGETGALTITGSLEDSGGGFIATYLINGISFRIELKESARRDPRGEYSGGSDSYYGEHRVHK